MKPQTSNIYCVHFDQTVKKYATKNFWKHGQEKHIADFLMDKMLEGNKEVTMYKYLKDLKFWQGALSKSFDACGLQDIKEAVVHLQTLPLAESTKQRRKISLKVFYRWLRKCEKPEETGWIKTNMRIRRITPPQLLLRPEDISRMLGFAKNNLERAVLMLHWESGGRVGEILNIRIGDVLFEDQLAVIRLDGKTGPRQIYVREAYPYLEAHLSGHQQKDDNEAHLFLNAEGEPMLYYSFCRILKRLGAEAGIRKPLNTHFFRHSRATFLARKGWSEAQLCTHLGWVYGSAMPRTYIHMAGSDLREAVLNL